MKKILALITTLLLVLSMTFTAWADNGSRKVYDNAGLLSNDEKFQIQDVLDEASEHIGMDVIFLTDSAEGYAPLTYAENFYDAGSFGTGDDHSGLLLFVDMKSRSVYMSTTGKAINYYTDDRIYNITDGNDALYDCLSNQNYVGAVRSCTSLITGYYDKGIESNQYTYDGSTGEIEKHRSIRPFELIVALAIPALIAFLYINSIKKQYNMENDVALSIASKLAYTAIAGFAFAITADELMDHHVTQRVLPRASSNSSSPTGHSGRSTIHMGSSGTFHGGGGGGRHF